MKKIKCIKNDNNNLSIIEGKFYYYEGTFIYENDSFIIEVYEDKKKTKYLGKSNLEYFKDDEIVKWKQKLLFVLFIPLTLMLIIIHLIIKAFKHIMKLFRKK